MIVRYKDKDVFFIIEPFLKDINNILNKIEKEKNICLVIFNTKENFEIINENWKRFIGFENFNIYFVNPFSNLNKKWIINPHIHTKINDQTTLKKGLKSMFDMVDSITEEEIKEKI